MDMLTFEELTEFVYANPDKSSTEAIALIKALEKEIWFSEEYEMTRELQSLIDAMEFLPNEKTLLNILNFASLARKRNEKVDKYLKVAQN
jgi:polyribonucleotide nucleotidyltransferase